MSFPLSAFGVNPDDIRYLHCDAVVRGKGRDRLKYCDLEGRWILSGRSIPYISATFNHIENLNYAQGPLFDITQPALDAIGMVGWTPEKKKKPPVFVKPPVVEVIEEVVSPREDMPYRSAGYGPAHQKRKLSVPDRSSRSPSPVSRGVSPTPEFDRYATKYQRKDSITYYGTKWNSAREDPGYSSGAPSPNTGQDGFDRMPHRTQQISPLPEHHGRYDSLYDPTYLKRATDSSADGNDVSEIKARADRAKYHPQTSSYPIRNDYRTEQSSKRGKTAEEHLFESYHKMTTRGRPVH